MHLYSGGQMKVKNFGLDLLNLRYFLDIQDKMPRKINIQT